MSDDGDEDRDGDHSQGLVDAYVGKAMGQPLPDANSSPFCWIFPSTLGDVDPAAHILQKGKLKF